VTDEITVGARVRVTPAAAESFKSQYRKAFQAGRLGTVLARLGGARVHWGREWRVLFDHRPGKHPDANRHYWTLDLYARDIELAEGPKP
jgi:hypothetical protein